MEFTTNINIILLVIDPTFFVVFRFTDNFNDFSVLLMVPLTNTYIPILILNFLRCKGWRFKKDDDCVNNVDKYRWRYYCQQCLVMLKIHIPSNIK